jgi:adenosylcobinamide-GDP ribazoletransferase
MLLKSILALLQFTTVLPLGKPADFEYFARRSYLYPLAGYVTGGIAALCIFWISNPLIAAAVALAVLLFVSGCNHFDGLLDFGDGVMAHGSREKRIRALTDRQIGAGGVAFGITFILLSFAALSSSPVPAACILAAEVGGKFAMAFLTATGAPFKEGIHSYLYQHSKWYFPLLAALFVIPLAFLPLGVIPLAAAALVMVLCPVIILYAARALFGGVNGDVAGAANEITRAIILLALVLA